MQERPTMTNGDLDALAREQLVESNLSFVYQVARYLKERNPD